MSVGSSWSRAGHGCWGAPNPRLGTAGQAHVNHLLTPVSNIPSAHRALGLTSSRLPPEPEPLRVPLCLVPPSLPALLPHPQPGWFGKCDEGSPSRHPVYQEPAGPGGLAPSMEILPFLCSGPSSLMSPTAGGDLGAASPAGAWAGPSPPLRAAVGRRLLGVAHPDPHPHPCGELQVEGALCLGC